MNKKRVIWLCNLQGKNGNSYSPAMIWWYGILETLGYEVMYSPYEEYKPEEFYQSAKAYKPDFIIHCAYDKIHTEFIRLQEFTKVYVLQSDDAWRYHDFAKFWIPFVNGTLAFGGQHEAWKQDVTEDRWITFKWTWNPFTMNYPLQQKTCLLSHTGGLHGDRVEKINEFNNSGYPVNVLQNSNYAQATYLWAISKYSLCFTSNSVLTGREVKGRVSEIPWVTVLLTQDFPGFDEYYDLKNDVVLFDTVPDAIEKIKYFENNSIEYNRVFENGRKRLLKQTALHDWNDLLCWIDKDYTKKDCDELIKNILNNK